jgi:AcrR family transcriptional regulator
VRRKRASLPVGNEPGSEQAPKLRLLGAGKMLFARLGYEQTSTAAITRHANTSESQLMRYFDGKRGLLAAIFDESWRLLNQQIENSIRTSSDAVTAIEGVLEAVIGAFDRDADLASLFLFEGRRIHAGERDVVLSRGYVEFAQTFQDLVRRAQKEEAIAAGFDVRAISSALIGAAEGMMRDRLIAQRSGRPSPFSHQQVRRVFAALLQAAREPKSASSSRSGRQPSPGRRRTR